MKKSDLTAGMVYTRRGVGQTFLLVLDTTTLYRCRYRTRRSDHQEHPTYWPTNSGAGYTATTGILCATSPHINHLQGHPDLQALAFQARYGNQPGGLVYTLAQPGSIEMRQQ